MWERFKHALGFYRQVISTEWKHRHENPLPKRRRGESGFLPAMLEIQETPPPPLAHITMWMIIVLFAIAIAWMILGTVDIVVSAAGKILPDNRIKIVQAAQGGIVDQIFVRDGDVVRAGDELLTLDRTVNDADETSIKSELAAMRLEVEMTRQLMTPRRAAPPLADLDTLADISADKIARQQQAMESLLSEHNSRLEQLQGEIAALKKDLVIEEQGIVDAEQQRAQARLMTEQRLQVERHQIDKLETLLPMAKSEYETYDSLYQENVVSRIQVQQSQEKYISLEKDLKYRSSQLSEIQVQGDSRQLEYQQRGRQYEHRVKSLQEKIANREQALLVERSRFRREMNERHGEAVRKMVELEQNLIKAEQAESYHRIVAPTDGIVQQLAIHTRGAVVQAAQALLVIVPEDRVLEIEAMVENKDIGFLYNGQAVEIKIDAFPYTKYGLVHGEISHLSADAIEDERRGLVYQARIKLHDTALIVNGEEKSLAPGMSVVAEIKTGNRRIIEFFMAPLIQYGKESLKER